MTIEMIKCEICGYVMGTADTEKLEKPLTGAMFGSKREGQYPRPFFAEAEWLWIRCPFCRKRPFLHDDRVTTEDGRVIMAKDPNAPKEQEPEPETTTEAEETENGYPKQKRKQRADSARR